MRLFLRLVASLLLAVLLMTTTGRANQFVARLTGFQETSHSNTSAHGTGTFNLTEEGLAYNITIDGLMGLFATANFRDAAIGVDGAIVHTITFSGSTARGIWTPTDAEPLTDELKTDLLLGHVYVNIEVGPPASGAIRGQVLLSSGTALGAKATPAQENHTVTSTATGTASLALVEEGLIYKITVDGLSGQVTAAHFYNARFGLDGPSIKTITFTGNTAEGVWHYDDAEPLTDALREQLVEGNVYLNISTAMNSTGEIRGQVRLDEGWGFEATLTATQETGPDTSSASGTAAFQLTDAGLMYKITVTGLTGPIGAAHIHMGPIGVAGPIIRALSFNPNGTAEGVWMKTDAQPFTDSAKAELMRGHLYVNVHTSHYPAGEIRGQILMDTPLALYSADLTGDAEKTNVQTNGQGTGIFQLADGMLMYQITVDSLAGTLTAAHFHYGPDGMVGPILRTLDLSGNTMVGMWMASDPEPFTPEIMRELVNGDIYLEFHTSAYPSGELRGQVITSNGAALANEMSAPQEVPGNPSTATGTGSFTLTPAGVVYKITVSNLTGPIGAAHFHYAETGVSGPIVKTITFTGNTAYGVWTSMDAEPLTDELIEDLLSGELYVNVHTSMNPGGEIRGQVLLNGGTGLGAGLDPSQETQQVTSTGTGTTGITLTEEGLVYSATVSGLTGAIGATHFHEGATGVDGPIIKTLEYTGTAISGLWKMTDTEPLTAEAVNAMNAGNLYMNVHTSQYAGGEIRGQLGPNLSPETVGPNAGGTLPGQFALAQNYPNPFNPSTAIHFNVPQSGRVRLRVFNVMGQLVATLLDNPVTAGVHDVRFSGEALPSGIYFYKLEAGNANLTRKMVLLK